MLGNLHFCRLDLTRVILSYSSYVITQVWKGDKVRGLLCISLFRNEFNIYNNTEANHLIDAIYHHFMTLKLL